MKARSTRKALLASLLSLVVCVSLLVGSTFAWFTDSVTSAQNVIQSGNLDVELYYQAEGQTDWNKVTPSTNVFKAGALWEPGYTEVVKLKVVNEGSLALKYTLGVNVVGEVKSTNVNGNEFKLSDFIKYGIVDGAQNYTRETAVAAVDATATALAEAYTSDSISLPAKNDTNSDEKIVTMVVYMPTTVGNDANHAKGAAVPTINLGINLFATQDTVESDSFGSDYDKNATYPAFKTETAKEGDTITAGEVAITLPTGAEKAKYTVNVDNKVVTTDADGDTTVSFDIELLKNGVKVAPQDGVTYLVGIYIGENLNVTEVTHKGAAVADFDYDSTTGVVSFETDSFSPFEVIYYSGEVTAENFKDLLARGGEFTLTEDLTLDKALEIPAGVAVELDLNGKTITGTKGRDADDNRIHVIVNNGILNIKEGTVKSAGNDGGSAIYNNAGATLTIEDVTLYGAPQSDPVYEAGVNKPYPSYAVNNYGNAVVNGATVKSYHGAIATGDDGVTVINDADIDVGLGQSTGITSYAIYSFGNAQVTVNGGKFAFTKQEVYVNGGNTFCELGTNPIMINGGNYIGTSFSTGADREYVIKGGTFDVDPSAYVADSYQAVKNANGTWTVLPKVEGAELTYYADGLYSDANSSKNYYVASGAGMDTVAEKINDGTLAKNTNITLLTDIDLTDVDYAPISGNKGDSWYTGTFDGQNHTITGMTVNAYEGGLIGSSNGTVKNVIIDGATVTGSYHAAGIVGTGYGSIQNCTVKNSAIIGNYAGALRGYSASGTNTGNTVENCTINGKYAAGGLFGLVTADGKNTISDNTVKNCDIYCEVPSGNSYNGIGEVVGRSASDKVVIENNMTENVTLH